MALNKFCPVSQGEYYNIKPRPKVNHFLHVFFAFFYIFTVLLRMCFIFTTYSIFYPLSYTIYAHLFIFSQIPDCKEPGFTFKMFRVLLLSSIYIYEFLPSSVNQNSTPFSQFFTPYCWLCASMIAFDDRETDSGSSVCAGSRLYRL